MSNDKTGGPAFPKFWTEEDRYSGATLQLSSGGMTLRDYFAAKAMVAHLSKPEVPGDDVVAVWSYEMADAMLKARDT